MKNLLTNKKFLLACSIILSITLVGCIIVIICGNKNDFNTTNSIKPTSTVPHNNTEPINNINPEHYNTSNNSYTNYTKEYQEYLNLPEDQKQKVEVIPRKTEIPYEELNQIIEDQKKNLEQPTEQSEISEPVETTLPEKFDLRDKIDLHVGNQREFGICWAFSSLTCVETNLALTQSKKYDFSEAYIDYMASSELSNTLREPHSGGEFDTLIKYLRENNGFVLDSDIPLQNYSREEYMTFNNKDLIQESVYKYVNFPEYKQDLSKEELNKEDFAKYQSAIKTHIMNYGSISVSISPVILSGGFNYCSNASEQSGGPHAVSIIGWDDNYSKENFMSPTFKTPKNDGAYIILNSWGVNSGDNGYFYMSYEDYFADNDLSGVVSTNPKDRLDLRTINNPGLENYIRTNYKNYITNNNYINPIVLSTEVKLDLSNCNLTSTNGLEYFTELNVLDLSNNSITDVSNLSKLNSLTTLNLSNNPNVTGYENLTNLFCLNLTNCNISTIPNISRLSNLYELDLSKNRNITNIEILSNLKINNLHLSDCNIKDLTTISTFTKTDTLDLSNNPDIIDFKPLMSLPTLSDLNLSNCNITDVSNLPYEKEFYKLDLSNNKNLVNINKLENVTSLNLSNCSITDLEEVSRIGTLDTLNLSNNNITDISKLDSLNDLVYLDLSGNKNIQQLSLNNNSISTLILDDCNIDNNTDFSGLPFIYSTSFKSNDIDLLTINEKVRTGLIEVDSMDVDDFTGSITISNTNITKTIQVPNGICSINLKDIASNYYDIKSSDNITINGTTATFVNGVNTYDSITITSANVGDNFFNCTLTLKFEVINNLQPTNIRVSKLPNKTCLKIGEIIGTDEIEVENFYGNGVYAQTSNFTVTPPAEIVAGINYYTVNSDNLSVNFVIYYIDVTNNIVLELSNARLYETVLSRVVNSPYEIVSTDEKHFRVELTNAGKTLVESYMPTIEGLDLKDISCLYPLNYTNICIKYSGYKITEDELDALKHFTNLTTLTIDKPDNLSEDDVIVRQNYFTVYFI